MSVLKTYDDGGTTITLVKLKGVAVIRMEGIHPIGLPPKFKEALAEALNLKQGEIWLDAGEWYTNPETASILSQLGVSFNSVGFNIGLVPPQILGTFGGETRQVATKPKLTDRQLLRWFVLASTFITCLTVLATEGEPLLHKLGVTSESVPTIRQPPSTTEVARAVKAIPLVQRVDGVGILPSKGRLQIWVKVVFAQGASAEQHLELAASVRASVRAAFPSDVVEIDVIYAD